MITGAQDIVAEMGNDFMEELSPLLDAYHLARLKIQQAKARQEVPGDDLLKGLTDAEHLLYSTIRRPAN